MNGKIEKNLEELGEREKGENEIRQELEKKIQKRERDFLVGALKEENGIEKMKAWRELDGRGRKARKIRKFFEKITAAKEVLKRTPERKEEILEVLFESLNLRNLEKRSRTDQFLAYFSSECFDSPEIKDKLKKEVVGVSERLREIETKKGKLNLFGFLSENIALDLKRKWIENYILPRIDFLESLDLKDARELPPKRELPEERKIKEIPGLLPPADEDSFRPSMEETEPIEEGEPGAYFKARPFYGGYWKEKTWDEWDGKNLLWREKERHLKELEKEEIEEESKRIIQGIIRGGKITSLPLPYGFSFKKDSLCLPEGVKIKILKDQKGNYVLDAREEKSPVIPFSLILGKRKKEKPQEEPKQVLQIEIGSLSKETRDFLEDLKKDRFLSQIEKARKLKLFVKKKLKYSGDSLLNSVYWEESEKFFQKIEEYKKADCDVANTYFLGLLSFLGISGRIATGHYIKVKDNQGVAVFSSGSRHAWSEVWDGKTWRKVDATPAGDPRMDEEEMDEAEGEILEGDFGEIEAEILLDQEIKEMIKRAEEEIEKEKKITPEEQRILNFAKEAECSEEEAKRILAQIGEARKLKDKKGRLILDRLSNEFIKIIQENLKEVPSFRAPVRISGADELVEPVEAWLDIKTGESEPSGFGKYEKKIEKEQVYGGFDVIFVKDKSGSMAETDPKSGKIKYLEQQKGNFLLNESLHRFSQLCKRQRIKLLSPIDVRYTDIGFQGDKAEAFFPLTDKWGPKEQLAVWKKSAENIGGGTPDNLGLKVAREMIEKDIKETKKKGEARLRLVIVLADGGTDPDKVVEREKEKKLLRGMGVIVIGLGLTEAGKAMEATYYPEGGWVESVSEMPEWVAEKVIEQVKRLYPRKISRARKF